MHVAFIPYGGRTEVEQLLNDMDAQKHQMKCWKGKKTNYTWVPGRIRKVPFGVYEYVFPKEDLDKVLTTLGDYQGGIYAISKLKVTAFRKALKLKKIPKFDTSKKYLWRREWVSTILLGIREDGEFTEPKGMGDSTDWTHEAL